MDMNYCMQCGTRLRLRFHEKEGRDVPWCDGCGAFRHPVFNTAVSMVVLNRTEDLVLLIQQYGKPSYILPAGYVEQGESAEETAVRELREELGLAVRSLRFNRSRYFAPSNTLMLNYAVTVAGDGPKPNWEIDAWRWFTPEEARQNIRPGSLAAAFLNAFLDGAPLL